MNIFVKLSICSIFIIFQYLSNVASISVKIYHLIDNTLWGETDGSGIQGIFPCQSIRINSHLENLQCEIFSSDVRDPGDKTGRSLLSNLQQKFYRHTNTTATSSSTRNDANNIITVSMYHIHTWRTLTNPPYKPDKLALPTTYTLVESEESHARFHRIFDLSFPHYDVNSTTSPFSTIQRIYFRGWNTSDFLPLRPFDQLIHGAAFVASTCHQHNDRTKRINSVKKLMKYYRVDSLGKCMHILHVPEGIKLMTGKTEKESLIYKQQAISHYQFYLAFENTLERGYVTEKVFDALIAGIVPVYLGSKEDCQQLMPNDHSVIYVADFNYDMQALGSYLQELSKNETAYESYRSWRSTFSDYQPHELIRKSWPCRICEWAARKHLLEKI